jgi:hypothetical protein
MGGARQAMIHVPQAPEPPAFDERCRTRGNQWLEEHDAQNAPDYWSEFRPELRRAFEARCGWLAMWVSSGTVDHFHAQKTHPHLIYEWTNYRYADGSVNSAKKPQWAGRILDPFEVDDSWFEVLLPSCQLVIIEANVPPEFLDRVRFTVEKLDLSHGEHVVELRRHWLDEYEAEPGPRLP